MGGGVILRPAEPCTRCGGRGEDYRRRGEGALGRRLECLGRPRLRHRRDTCEALELAGADAASREIRAFALLEASGGVRSGPEK